MVIFYSFFKYSFLFLSLRYFIGFFEERALVLAKLGRHEQVLSMYVTVLCDIDRAIDYCDKVYKSKNKDWDQVK